MNDAAKWWYYVRQNGGYYPGALANLGYNVWDWDASRTSGVVNGSLQTLLFQDSAKTTPVASNSDPVGAWVDGVQGVDAIQATTANKPTYATNSLNGLPTLSFDGSDLLATGNISISTFAVWVVFRSSTANIVFEQSASSTSDNGQYLFTGTSAAINVYRASTRIYKTGQNLADNTYRSVRFEHQGTYASLKYFANNAELTTSTQGTPADIGTGTATRPLFIGGRSGATFPLTGNIAHLCIVSPYPTAAIIANMETYINGIWGVY